jgi:alpha-tubulin suppressor-like RCC1 family protein
MNLQKIANARFRISAKDNRTVVVNDDGAVDIISSNGFNTIWSDITQVNATKYCTIGLKTDCTVVYVGDDGPVIRAISNWRDIIAISSNDHSSYGVRADGTVVVAGALEDDERSQISSWRNVVALSCSKYMTAAVKKDGTISSFGTLRIPHKGGVTVNFNWRDITAVSINSFNAVGIKSNATVVSYGHIAHETKPDSMENIVFDKIDLSDWRNIVSVDTSDYAVIGVKANGTVVWDGVLIREITEDSFGDEKRIFGKFDLSGWRDIIAVSVGKQHIIGMKSDGSLIATGNNKHSQCDVSKEQLAKQRQLLQEKREKQQQSMLWKEQGLCRHCGGTLKKGLIFTKCTSCGKNN